MFNTSSAIEREFHPKYSLIWWLTTLFVLVTAATYIVSKILGEDIRGVVQGIGIAAVAMVVFSIAFAIRKIEFAAKVRIIYVFWPPKVFDYKSIFEIRLPEIVVDAEKPIKLENITNLDELQEEFRNLELMGVLPRGHLKAMQPASTQYRFRPKLGNILMALFSIFLLGTELFKISKEINVFWFVIVVLFFISDIFEKLFRKPKNA